MDRSTVTSKGQTTIPYRIRKKWKSSKLLWEQRPDGSAIVRPAPDLLSLFGAAKNDIPYDSDELEKARTAIADDAREGDR